MPRLNRRRYQQRLLLAMAAYIAAMLLVWPLVRTEHSLPLKWLLALTPTLPMLYVIALLVQRVRDGDELEQRLHLIALGSATAIVGTGSLIGGFLASAQVLAMDGSVLIWVFPGLLACYGAVRWWLVRRYGGGAGCEDDEALPLYWRMLFMAGMIGTIMLFAVGRITAGIVIGVGMIVLLLALDRYLERRGNHGKP